MKTPVAPMLCFAGLVLCAHLAAAQPGRGLAGGGPIEELAAEVEANSEAIMALESKMTLSDLPCARDEIARFDGTSWVCAPDPTALCDAVNRAICVKADQDGDSIRPLTCEPRCDCFQDALPLGPLTSCAETAPGRFDATVIETRARCVALESNFGLVAGCETSSIAACACESCLSSPFPIPTPCNCSGCPEGEFCSTPLFPLTGSGVCVRPCSGDDDCPLADIAVTLSLSRVSASGSAGVAHCSCSGTECPDRAINSTDGQACLAEFETQLGAPCTRLPGSQP